jgi:two-component system, OmpR family, phosphate regulon response regulator PhoB
MTTVLYADDDYDLRDLAAFKLEGAGYRVFTAPDGRTALSLAENGGIDVVLLDVMMPDTDGIEVCRRLRANPATADVPIVLLTAASNPSQIERGYEAGADDYILKPFSVRELPGLVVAVRERRRKLLTQRDGAGVGA